MHYRLTCEDKNVTANFSGRMDFATSGTFEDALKEIQELAPKNLVFDLSGVTHMDSIGLGMLLSAHEVFSDMTIRLRGAQPQVARVLDLTAAASMFEIS